MFKKEVTFILTLIAVLMPLIMHPFYSDSYYLPKAIFLYVMYFLLIFVLFKDRKKLSFDRIDKILLVFLIIALLSTIFSVNPFTSIFGSEYRYEGLIMLFFYGLTYYSAKNYMQINKKVVNCILATIVIISVYSILQFYNIDPIPKDEYHSNILRNSIGTQGNRNFLSSFITLFIPGAMGMYLLKGSKKALGVSIILFSSLLCTLTRSGWVAFLVYSVIGLIYIVKKFSKVLLKRSFILVGLFVALFLVINITSEGMLLGRSEQLKKDIMISDEQSGSGRIFIWKLAIDVTKNHPLLGSGPDTFKNVIQEEFKDKGTEWIEEHNSIIDKAHNEFLQISATMGIPALIVYIIFLWLSVKDNIKNMWRSDISFLISITVIGYIVQSFFNISVINVAPLFWMLLGISSKLVPAQSDLEIN